MGDLGEKPLQNISESFKALAANINSGNTTVEVAPFSRACSFISPLFGCLGIAFKFAEMDYVAKVFLSVSILIIDVVAAVWSLGTMGDELV